MTKLRPATPLVRETDVFERSDAIVVSLEPRCLTIRLKGHRGEMPHSIEYGALLDYLRKRDYQHTVDQVKALRKGA